MTREYELRPFSAPVHPQIDYPAQLNEQQLAAVTAPPGPALVIAGAGSGKTRTLTYRVAWLLEQGIPPDRILLLTFTNKAAKEMMRRVKDLLGHDLTSLWGGTFHSVGNRLLRQHAPRLGYERDFGILDREDAEHLIATCVAESDVDPKAARFPKADVLAEVFSLAVNTHRTVPEVLEAEYPQFWPQAPAVEDIRQRYAVRKRAANLVDFDDLLVLWLQLLQDHPDLCDQYQRRFQFVLVDEYQDTNKLQGDLVDLLAARHHNVMAVGDDAQSIYAWRGANFQNILKFPQRYPEARTYRIETNYRSTPEILEVANAAIAANVHQFAKTLAPARKSGSKPVVVACGDAGEQAAFVAQRLLELREEGVNLRQIAVLYRSHFHTLELQLELTRRNIAFSITSGVRFFEQAHIKDATAYLKLAVNPRDELAFRRLVQMLPGIGGKGARKLWSAFAGEAPPPALPEEPGSRPSEPVLAPRLAACAAAVPKKAARAWEQFVATLTQLEGKEIRGNASRMLHLVLEAGYVDYVEQNYTNPRLRLEDLQQLAVFAQQFSAVEDFLTQLALLTSVESEEERPIQNDEERIRLSTIHQAKGLEFDVVFVIMLCDGLFPSARSLESGEGEEEERRLMYVAITRARNELYLTYPLIRGGYNVTGDILQRPSRFLREIPNALVDEWNLRRYYSGNE